MALQRIDARALNNTDKLSDATPEDLLGGAVGGGPVKAPKASFPAIANVVGLVTALAGKLGLTGGNLSGALVMDNATAVQGKTTAAVARNLVSVTAADIAEIGTIALPTNIRGADPRPDYNGAEIALASDITNVVKRTQGTAKTLTGHAIASTATEFTDVPADCLEVVIGFYGVKGPLAAAFGLRLGYSGAYETSGYHAGHSKVKDATANSVSQSGTYFVLGGFDTTGVELYGECRFTKVADSSNRWIQTGMLHSDDGTKIARFSSGMTIMSGALTKIGFHGDAGNFSAGVAYIVYYHK